MSKAKRKRRSKHTFQLRDMLCIRNWPIVLVNVQKILLNSYHKKNASTFKIKRATSITSKSINKALYNEQPQITQFNNKNKLPCPLIVSSLSSQTVYGASKVGSPVTVISSYKGIVWSALCPAAFTFPNVSQVPIRVG